MKIINLFKEDQVFLAPGCTRNSAYFCEKKEKLVEGSKSGVT